MDVDYGVLAVVKFLSQYCPECIIACLLKFGLASTGAFVSASFSFSKHIAAPHSTATPEFSSAVAAVAA